MCGRVVITSSPEELSEYVGARDVVEALEGPDHNIAPSRLLPVAWADDQVDSGRALGVAQWGLVPSWAADPAIGARLFNARAETVAVKPSFRSAFRRRRCLVLIDGFYEWGSGVTSFPKQPWFVHRADGFPLALAGLWEPRSDGDGRMLRTCTVVTVPANADLALVHHRMPAVVAEDDWDRWLDLGTSDRSTLEEVLAPSPDGLLALHPVDRRVNDARQKGRELTIPISLEALPGRSGSQEVLW